MMRVDGASAAVVSANAVTTAGSKRPPALAPVRDWRATYSSRVWSLRLYRR